MVLSLATAESLVRVHLAQREPDAARRRLDLDVLMRRLSSLPEEALPNLLERLGVPPSICHGDRWSRRSRLRHWLEREPASQEEGHGVSSVSRAEGDPPRELGE